MSRRTLPLLYINLGGEMMYIIEERLTAQSVPPDKAAKVLTDLVSLILNPKILDEILQPQDMHSREALEVIFENIANSTSMRIDSDSLNRMYSIMLMSVKYQFQRAGSPQDIVGITLNHMDGMRQMLTGTSRAHLLLDKAYDVVVEAYKDTLPLELYLIRLTILEFFQDVRARVRKYVQAGQQISKSGKFLVPLDTALGYGVKIPVQVRYLGENGKTTKLTMVHEETANYTEHDGVISWAPSTRKGETRGTHLGTNFHKYGDLDPVHDEPKPAQEVSHRGNMLQPPIEPPSRPMSRQELSLLRTVIDSRGGQPNSTFRLNLYNRQQPVEQKTMPGNGRNGRQPVAKGPTTRVVLPKISWKQKPIAEGEGEVRAQSLHGTPQNKKKTLQKRNSFEQ